MAAMTTSTIEKNEYKKRDRETIKPPTENNYQIDWRASRNNSDARKTTYWLNDFQFSYTHTIEQKKTQRTPLKLVKKSALLYNENTTTIPILSAHWLID